MSRYFVDKIIAYKEKGTYIAVSLNFDLVAEGNDIKEALMRLEDAVRGYLMICLEDNLPDEKVYRKAPKKYQDQFASFSNDNPPSIGNNKRYRSIREKFKKQQLQTFQKTIDSRELCHA